MKYMNAWEIDRAIQQHGQHPVLGPAARFLDAFKDEVNKVSDGWAYWTPPIRAAAKLMTLLEAPDATEADLRKALAPIKGFMTRRGIKAGMAMPPLL